jgi:putative PIN family toxin of toxin-antitoxin system
MAVRAVVDTNVLVSGLIAGQSPPAQIVDAWLDRRFVLVTSIYQVEELNHVLAYPRLAGRIRLEVEEVETILAGLLLQADVVPGDLVIPGVTRDPKDDPIVACALEGQAGYIVSGDGDLLALEAYEGIEIVTPRQFIEVLAVAD